jgi:hypothetical protein
MTDTVSQSTTSTAATPDQNADILVRFKWGCGRMGNVEGMFVTTRATLAASYGKQVYFGEILGKHSEVYGELNESDITVLTDDAVFLAKFTELLGRDISGYNPLSYLSDNE